MYVYIIHAYTFCNASRTQILPQVGLFQACPLHGPVVLFYLVSSPGLKMWVGQPQRYRRDWAPSSLCVLGVLPHLRTSHIVVYAPYEESHGKRAQSSLFWEAGKSWSCDVTMSLAESSSLLPWCRSPLQRCFVYVQWPGSWLHPAPARGKEPGGAPDVNPWAATYFSAWGRGQVLAMLECKT